MSEEVSAELDNAENVLRSTGFIKAADAVAALRTRAANDHLMMRQREREASDAERGFAIIQTEARTFVDFVLRHMWPERAKSRTYEENYSIVKHHPFARQHALSEAVSATTGAAEVSGEVKP